MNTFDLINSVRHDCYHFLGDRPCIPHRASGKRCTCDEYLPITRRGVIIKLGAAGDVLRTTPLLRALDPVRTGTRILWITHHTELLPDKVCEISTVSPALLARLHAAEFDFCWNLDKDLEACALAELVRARTKRGYGLRDGVPWPVDDAARHKFATGLDNTLSRANTKTYVEEIFDIVGLSYARHEYWLRQPDEVAFQMAAELLPANNVWVGLNTGAGKRWTSRIWPPEYWLELCVLLRDKGMKPIILGGLEEDEKNSDLAAKSDCPYFGVLSLEVFFALLHRCNVVVSGVTQAMHLAIGARTPLVLLNNIFNPSEFELYGRGVVLGPPNPCDCYYDSVCRTGRSCIREITAHQVLESILMLASLA